MIVVANKISWQQCLSFGLRFVELSCLLIGKRGRGVAISWASLALGSALSSEWVYFYFIVISLMSHKYITCFGVLKMCITFQLSRLQYLIVVSRWRYFYCLIFYCATAPSLQYNLENLVHYTDSTSSRLSRLEFICLELEYDVIITQRLETAQQHNTAACLQWHMSELFTFYVHAQTTKHSILIL